MVSPRALGNYIVYYNETSGQIVFYDVRALRPRYEYTLTGKLTASAVYGNYYVAGTDKGEVIVFDTGNMRNIFRWVNAYFGSVVKLGFVDQYRLVALFSSNRLVVYDLATGEYRVYMPTDLAGMSGGAENYTALYPLDFEIVNHGVLLVQKPYYNYMRLVVFLEKTGANGTAKPLKGYRVWVELSGLVLSGKTDDSGMVVFGLPEARNWTVHVYVESREYKGFAYMYTYKLGANIPPGTVKVITIDYNMKGELVPVPMETGYILSIYSLTGVNLVLEHSRTLENGEQIIDIQDTGYGVYVLATRGNTMNMTIYSYNFSVIASAWQIVGSQPVITRCIGDRIVVGFSDGHLFFYNITGRTIRAFSGYVLRSAPVYVDVYGDYYVAVDSSGNIYGFYYDSRLHTIYPVYRNPVMNGLNVLSTVEKVYATDKYIFMYGTPYSMLVFGLGRAVENGIDIRKYVLYTVEIHVVTPNGGLPHARVVLTGNIVGYEAYTDNESTARIDYVVAGNYTVHVYSPSILYRNITTHIYVDRDMEATVKLPYNTFNVTIRILDNETRGPVYIDVPYSIQGGNKTLQGVYRAGEDHITVSLEPGDYQLAVEGITAYRPASIRFSVPENLTVTLYLSRVNYTIGVRLIDESNGKDAEGKFMVRLRGVFGRVYTRNITGSLALFRIDFIGKAGLEVIPLDTTARYYKPLNTTLDIIGVGTYKVYLERKKYTVTFRIIDKLGNSLAKDVIMEINGKKYSVKNGELKLTLYAGPYYVKVYGNMYRDFKKTIEVTGNGTVNIPLTRKYGLIQIVVKDMYGSPMKDMPVYIRGVDVIYAVTLYSNDEGKVVAPIPYGNYVVEVGDGDKYQVTEVHVTVPMSEAQEVVVRYTIKGLLLSHLIWIILIVAGIVVSFVLHRYKVGSRLKNKLMGYEEGW